MAVEKLEKNHSWNKSEQMSMSTLPEVKFSFEHKKNGYENKRNNKIK